MNQSGSITGVAEGYAKRRERGLHKLQFFVRGWFFDRYVKKYLPDATTILDAGCGDGYKTAPLSQTYPDSEIVGVDICPEGISNADKLCGQSKNTRFLVGDIFHLSESVGSKVFELIALFQVLHHIRLDEGSSGDDLGANLDSHLAPTGTIAVMETFPPEQAESSIRWNLFRSLYRRISRTPWVEMDKDELIRYFQDQGFECRADIDFGKVLRWILGYYPTSLMLFNRESEQEDEHHG